MRVGFVLYVGQDAPGALRRLVWSSSLWDQSKAGKWWCLGCYHPLWTFWAGFPWFTLLWRNVALRPVSFNWENKGEDLEKSPVPFCLVRDAKFTILIPVNERA